MTYLEKIAQEAGAEAARAIVEEATSEAVAEAAAAAEEAGVDASPDELAQAAASIVDEKVEEKAAEYCDAIEKEAAGAEDIGFAVEEAKRQKQLQILRHAGVGAGAGAATGAGLGALLGKRIGLGRGTGARAGALVGILPGALTGDVVGRLSKLKKKEASFLVKKAAFEVEVTKIARHLLATSGFDPDTGERISRMSLARTPEEVKYAAALESLEAAGWPVQWDPAFLARAAEEG